MKIYLLRHGRTAYNDEKRYQGRRTDLPLSDAGMRALKTMPFEAEKVCVSPLRRARQSAQILFPAARQEVVADFAEMDFGVFEGRSYLEMEHDADYRAWVDGGCEGRCPGGEDKPSFCARTCAAFAAALTRAAARGDERLVIVAHGGTLRAVMSAYALPERGYFDWNAPCGGGYALAWDEELWRGEGRLRLLEEIAC